MTERLVLGLERSLHLWFLLQCSSQQSSPTAIKVCRIVERGCSGLWESSKDLESSKTKGNIPLQGITEVVLHYCTFESHHKETSRSAGSVGRGYSGLWEFSKTSTIFHCKVSLMLAIGVNWSCSPLLHHSKVITKSHQGLQSHSDKATVFQILDQQWTIT